jgi:hypothetical protein
MMSLLVQRKFAIAICFASLGCIASQTHAQQPETHTSLDIAKVLGNERLCMVGNGSVQFLNEDEFVLLVGPDTNCYRSVESLELVVITKQGKILARKSWPSTYRFVALPEGRIAISGNGDITVLNDALKVVQTIPLPPTQRSPVALQKEGSDTLLARLPTGEATAYTGAPLVQTSHHETNQDDQFVCMQDSGDAVVIRKQQLLALSSTGDSAHLTDLVWLHDCNKLCQAWSSGTTSAVSENCKRAVFVSSGTRFPVTDESGMFPFYRILVVDLETGKELYRKEFDTKTFPRITQLSPNGDLLLMGDGDRLNFQSIQ